MVGRRSENRLATHSPSSTIPLCRVLALVLGCAVASALASGKAGTWKSAGTLNGHAVEIMDPGLVEPDGFEPNGPASVCVVLPAVRQCYTPSNENGSAFGRDPQASVMSLGGGLDAIVFSADSGGVSGWMRKVDILKTETHGGKQLESLLGGGVVLSNQSEWRLWSEPSISSKKILVAADYVWGDGESHYGPHRFKVSVYVFGRTTPVYFLQDEYMTMKKYDTDSGEDVLRAERLEIFARLRRLH